MHALRCWSRDRPRFVVYEGDLLTRPVEDTYIPDKHVEAESVFGADDPAHPAVTYLHKSMKEVYVGGPVQAINRPLHYDYVALRCASNSSPLLD